MKKIFSTILISSLFIPTLISAQTDDVVPEVREQPQTTLYEEGRSDAAEETERPRPVLYSKSTSTVQQRPEERKELRKVTQAEIRQNATSTRLKMASTTREAGFCAQIDKILINVGTGAQTSGEKRTENFEKRDTKREEKRTEVDERREENDTKRKNQLEELTKRAKTDEQKKAVEAFITAIDKALAVKKTAIDALLLAHRNEVDALVTKRKAAAEKALTTLTNEIDTAKAKAKTDCTNNVSGDIVRTNLKDAIQKAQLTYRIAMRSLQKEISETKIKERKMELKAIEETFKKSVEQAKKELKEAFRTTTSPLPTASTTTN